MVNGHPLSCSGPEIIHNPVPHPCLVKDPRYGLRNTVQGTKQESHHWDEPAINKLSNWAKHVPLTKCPTLTPHPCGVFCENVQFHPIPITAAIFKPMRINGCHLLPNPTTRSPR